MCRTIHRVPRFYIKLVAVFIRTAIKARIFRSVLARLTRNRFANRTILSQSSKPAILVNNGMIHSGNASALSCRKSLANVIERSLKRGKPCTLKPSSAQMNKSKSSLVARIATLPESSSSAAKSLCSSTLRFVGTIEQRSDGSTKALFIFANSFGMGGFIRLPSSM